MRARLAGISAWLCLAASLIAAVMAVLELVGIAKLVPPIEVQFGVAVAAVLLVVALVPQGFAPDGLRGRDVTLKLHPSAFRQELTGPFAERSRRAPPRLMMLFVPMMVLAFVVNAIMPVFLMLASVFLARSAAYQGVAAGIVIDRFLGTEPKLKRNRRRQS